jgi:hypothetical protein
MGYDYVPGARWPGRSRSRRPRGGRRRRGSTWATTPSGRRRAPGRTASLVGAALEPKLRAAVGRPADRAGGGAGALLPGQGRRPPRGLRRRGGALHPPARLPAAAGRQRPTRGGARSPAPRRPAPSRAPWPPACRGRGGACGLARERAAAMLPSPEPGTTAGRALSWVAAEAFAASGEKLAEVQLSAPTPTTSRPASSPGRRAAPPRAGSRAPARSGPSTRSGLEALEAGCAEAGSSGWLAR